MAVTDQADGISEHFIVTGTPGAFRNNTAGGLVGHLLTEQNDGTVDSTTIFSYAAPPPDGNFERDVVNVGDVTSDGIDDVAIFSEEFDDEQHERVGRILIVDGAALLDGLDLSSDVIQEIRGTPSEYLFGGMRGLGDYNDDGSTDLLVQVFYNGTWGPSVHIYSVVPEPCGTIWLAAMALLMMNRKLR